MGKTYISVKKIQLIPQGDKDEVNRVYQYIRDGMYYQNTAYNILISTIYAAIKRGASEEEIAELYRRGSRKPKKNDPNTAYMMQMCLIFLLDFRLQEA